MINILKIDSFSTVGILDLAIFVNDHAHLSRRELEKMGSLFLLGELLKTKSFELCYSPTNKPFLKGRAEHISISHSHDKLAIIINTNENTGIDIELIRDKVLKIQHKFLSEKELIFAKNDVEKLITIWAAKEVLYKVYGLKEVNFITDLSIENFDSSTIIGKIDIGTFKKKYKLACENVGEYKLVYVLNEL